MGNKFFIEQLVGKYCDIADKGTVVVIDTETTGLSNDDDVVQIAVLVAKQRKELFSKAVYLKNQVPINGTAAQEVNGLTDEFLAKEGMEPKVVLQDLLNLINSCINNREEVLIVGHNIGFDIRMLNNMFQRYELDLFPRRVLFCDTKQFVGALNLPKSVLPNNRLCSCEQYLHLEGTNSHDALDDVKLCYELFTFLTT